MSSYYLDESTVHPPRNLPIIDLPYDGVDKFAAQGFVSRTPELADLTLDSNRIMPFDYDGQSSYCKVSERGKNIRSMPERDGLVNLDEALRFMSEELDYQRDRTGRLEELAVVYASMRRNLTFVGQNEFDLAVNGLSTLWDSFLRENPTGQILVAPNPNTQTGGARYYQKSDTHVTNIIKQILAAKGVKVEDRLVHDIDELSARPEETLVTITDDWVITGTQMKERCRILFTNRRMQSLLRVAQIHALVAPRSMIEAGFAIPSFPNPIPVKAFFVANDVSDSKICHITGAHSTAGFGFATEIEAGLHRIKRVFKEEIPRSPLTTVFRPYWPREHSPVEE